MSVFGLFLQITSNRTRENYLKFQQGRLRLDTEKNFFCERVVGHRNRQNGGITIPGSVEIMCECGPWRRGLMVTLWCYVRLNDLRGLF